MGTSLKVRYPMAWMTMTPGMSHSAFIGMGLLYRLMKVRAGSETLNTNLRILVASSVERTWSRRSRMPTATMRISVNTCLLYTSDAADDLLCVDLGGRRIIKKKKKKKKKK